ncbi:MAG: glycosyltransferase [Candidatus Aadella gelida]|nr:glycosyltransferase [Candidatus Aadella gelida]
MSKKKIVIVYSTAGMGHKKAALVIFDVLKENENIDVEVMDILDLSGKFYKFLYSDAYNFAMSRGKLLWGFMYWLTNIPLVDKLTRKLKSVSDYVNLRKFSKALMDKKPDAVIATHFLVPSIAGILIKKGLESKIFTLMTDYGPHSFWLSDHVDRFFVGSDFAARKLAERNIPSEKIDVTGISTSSDFHQSLDMTVLRGRYGIDKNLKTIFLMSGGFGVGPISKMLVSLNLCSTPIQVIVVCGHNKKAYKNVEDIKTKLKYPIIPFGFTDKVAELMAVSDLMITKAGGISVTEALNTRLPMILFGSIPGQEAWNEKFLLTSGAARKAKKIKDIPIAVDEILSEPRVYDTFKKGTDSIRKPYAAEEIVKIVLEEIQG